MPESFCLSLGDIHIALVSDRPTGDFIFDKREASFLTQNPPDITLQVHTGGFPLFPPGALEPVFQTQVSWHLLRWGEKPLIRMGEPPKTRWLGVFEPDFRAGDIYLAPQAAPDLAFSFPFNYPMGEVYLMNLLGGGLGMLAHAAGVIYQGAGFLFTGQGGSGKTTTARLWQNQPGARVVNDDKIILRKVGGEYRLYGTPWHGQGGMALPESAPLKHVFVLKQAPHNAARPLHPAQAAGALLSRAFVPLWDAPKMAFTLDFLADLCLAVPCHELSFLPDTSAVAFVQHFA